MKWTSVIKDDRDATQTGITDRKTLWKTLLIGKVRGKIARRSEPLALMRERDHSQRMKPVYCPDKPIKTVSERILCVWSDQDRT